MNAHAAECTPVRRGIWLFPGVAAAALVDAVVAAEQLGLDEVWIADEGVAREPVAVLAAAALQTSRIRLAVGITSPIIRHPGAIASSLATLDELSGGRAVLGLGVGGDLTLAPFGLSVERPVAILREAILTARDVLRRTRSDRYTPPTHAMPARNVPIWVGARGSQLVRTAARHADGLFLSGCAPTQHEQIITTAAAVGPVPIAVYQTAVDSPVSPDEQDWNATQQLLAAELERHRPEAIGLNLVQLAGSASIDPVDLVGRAAELLHSI